MSVASRLIDYRAKRGANRDESARLLDQLAKAHHGYNLATALHYAGFVSEARSESEAEALHIEKLDEHVRAVAALLPFPVEMEADMGGTFTLQIDLGTREGEDDPSDRAGIDPDDPRARWWIETHDSADPYVEIAQLDAYSSPAAVADWLTGRALALACPIAVATQARPAEWATVARWEEAHRAAGTWPPSRAPRK